MNLDNQPVEVVTKGRHDPCVGIRAVPVAEAMVAIVLDHLLRFKSTVQIVEFMFNYFRIALSAVIFYCFELSIFCKLGVLATC